MQLFLPVADLNGMDAEFGGDFVQGFHAANSLKRHPGLEVSLDLAFSPLALALAPVLFRNFTPRYHDC
ncbi:MAG: hypothetical protein HGB06_09040 [Chlorobaculum sp.]|nr:hypothetical protein [Chlorobaculum sp.]